jgi:hypothetical protein
MARVFLDSEISNVFDIKLPFIAFGEDCERVIEDFKNGKTIVAFLRLEEAVRDAKKASLYVDGKLYKTGTPKEIYGMYRVVLATEKENKELINLNKPKIKKIKNWEGPVKIKDVIIRDEKKKERYAFFSGKILIDFLTSGTPDTIFGITLSKKPSALDDSEKVIEALSKLKNGKTSFILDVGLIDDGDYLLTPFCKQNNKRYEFGDAIEIRVRKIKT